MKRISWILIGLSILGSAFIGGCLRERGSLDETIDNETIYNYSMPDFEIQSFILSSGPPAYRGVSTSVTLLIRTGSTGISIPNGTEIFLDYKVELLRPDGTLESEPEGIEIIPEQKRFVFPGKVESWEINQIEPNLKVNTNPSAAEGDYFITLTWKFRGLVVDRNVLTFKIGKGWRQSQYGGWNIGYSGDQSPPLSETEKAEAAAIAINDSYLKDRKCDIIEIKSEFHELESFSGFFPVVRIDVGEPQSIGEIVSYIIDLEEKKVMNRTAYHREPAEYFTGEAFDEVKGNLIRKWDAENFAGFWRDKEVNTSTEVLFIDQDILNSSHRVIESRKLIYTTSPITLKYLAYAQANWTLKGSDGFYQAIGWLGEKYVYLQGNRLAGIIFEQNASEVKSLAVGESWSIGDGYRLKAESIDSKVPERQAWFSFYRNYKLSDQILAWYYAELFSYPEGIEQNDTPVFITYLKKVYPGRYTDNADLKYTWLRSQDITEIKEGATFGIMEVTSVDNGRIELRNKESIDLSPGNVIDLMGNISIDRRTIGIQVGSSNEYLSFRPFKVRKS